MLWGLPPTFCALVQRAGRAGRDLATESEAILIVPKSVMSENTDEAVQEVEHTVANMALEGEALGREITEDETATAAEIIDAEGIRVAALESEEEEPVQPSATTSKKSKRRKQYGKDTNIHETRALLSFVQTAFYRWQPWNNFFENAKKCELKFNMNSI